MGGNWELAIHFIAMKKPCNKLLKFMAIISFLIASHARSFAQTTGDEIIGTWMDEEKDGEINIYKTGNTYAGKLIWMKEPNDPETGKPRLDKNNPDVKLHKQPLLGRDIMYGFVFVKADKEWTDGKVYDGRSGKTYKSNLTLSPDKTLKLRGYIGAAWMGLGKTTTWTRVK